jgi:hypothetical protein
MITVKREPTIEVYPIEINTIKNLSNDKAEEVFTDLHGASLQEIGKLPLLWYNGIQIPPKYISSLHLDSNGFLPRLVAYFFDQTSEMISGGFALDNTIISLYIDSRTKDSGQNPALRPIRMDFKIIDYGYLEDSGLFFVQGVPNVDDLYLQQINSYPESTSYNVLDEISEAIKLGYSSNMSLSNDTMNWLNVGLENYEFIRDVTSKGYIDDDSFLTSYIDYYYYLNYINVETQFKENINEQTGILTMAGEGLNEADSQIVADLFLISRKTAYETRYNNTYDYYEVLNKSTKVSLRNGYRTELYYYDRTGNWEQKAGSFLKFNIETNTDGTGIVLKSFPNDTNDGGFFKKNTKSIYLPPVDIDNTHVNYNYADIINAYNLDEIDKVSIKVTLTEPNFNFYKCQKIKIVILDFVPGKQDNDLMVNQRLSGGWLIKAINYNYSPDIGLKQDLIMVKRELSADGNFNI